MILADLGADVIKIESQEGDDARRMAPTRGNESAYFLAINRNKRSAVMDLNNRGDLSQLLSLMSTTDVFVTNMRPSRLREFSLDFRSLAARYAKLIYADISGYGSSGPEGNRAGYDMVLQARTGLMSVTGEPGRAPIRVGVSILDMGAGMWLALAVLAALRLRESTGRGGQVSTSLLEVGAAYMSYDVAAFQMTGEVPQPRGSGHPAFEPYGVFRARDGYVAIGVGADKLFLRMCDALGLAHLPSDSRFASNSARVHNRAELRRLLERHLRRYPVGHWIELLVTNGIPAEPVADVEDLVGDPQLKALDCWLPLSLHGSISPMDHEIRVPGLPVRFAGKRPPVRRGPPTLGHDTQEIRAYARSKTRSKPR